MLIEGSFEPTDFGTGYACLKELREAIIDFKKGDGHDPQTGLRLPRGPHHARLLRRSAASSITMNPYGEMEMPGLAVVKTYYKGAF